MTDLAGKGDIRTVANGLLPSGQNVASMTKTGKAEVRAALEALLRIYDNDNARLGLALEQLDRAADEIERLTNGRDTMGNLWAKEKESRHAAEAEIERLTTENADLQRELSDTLLGPTMVQNMRAEVERLKAALHGRIEVATNLHMECERLRAAIRWALGEAPDADGIWFGDVRPPLEAKYWWRQKLRAALEPKP
jgi:chromosome segregation ATPase